LQAQARILAEERNEAREAFTIATINCTEAQQRLREMEDQRDFAMDVIKRLERERDEARILAQWFYTRLKQVCLDHPLGENWGGILARLEEAVLDDPWLEDAKSATRRKQSISLARLTAGAGATKRLSNRVRAWWAR
jgi:hypothetical protein